MDTVIVNVFLPVALAIVMFGLGLSLTTDDFVRVSRKPKAVAITLFCQLILLPTVCFALVVLLDLSPLLVRPSRRRWRSACTTARWPSRSRSASSTA